MLVGTGIWHGIYCEDLSGSLGPSTFSHLKLVPVDSLSMTSILRPKVEAVLDSAARAPFIGVFSVVMRDWIPLIDEYYYCASVSPSSSPRVN